MAKTILAVDVGYGNTKFVWGAARDASSEMIFKSIAPAVQQEDDDAYKEFAGSVDRVAITVNSKKYFVGPEAYFLGSSAPILGKDYVKHDEYLALLRGAMYFMMKKSGVIRKTIDGLVVGLPVSNFITNKQALVDLAKGVHTLPTPPGLRSVYGQTIDVLVDKVLVLPQPIGALRNYAGKMEAGDDSVNLIVDPGYNTFDWVTAYGARPDMQRSGSFDGGVAHILRTIGNKAGKDLGVGFIDFVQCEEALKKGVLWHETTNYPFTKYAAVADDAAFEIVNKFASSLDTSRPFNRIVMAGGGAKYYLNAMRKRFPDYEIMVDEDSVMANARGFYLFAAGLLF